MAPVPSIPRDLRWSDGAAGRGKLETNSYIRKNLQPYNSYIMKHIITVILLVFFCFESSFGQKIILKKATTMSSYRQGDGTITTGINAAKKFDFKLEGSYDLIPIGKKAANLEPYLREDAEAMSYIKKYKQRLQAGPIVAGIGFAGIIGGAVLIGVGLDEDNYNESLALTGLVIASGGLVVAFTAFFVQKSSNGALEKAVETYNRNKGYAYRSGVDFQLVVNGNGVGLSIGF